jgi:hypothetical protein
MTCNGCLRAHFRRALRHLHEPYAAHLIDVLRDFDQAWTDFEHNICFCYFTLSRRTTSSASNASELRFRSNDSLSPNDDSFFTVLLSETVLYGLKQKYFTVDDLELCEPFLMFALPRLAMVVGTVSLPDYSTVEKNQSAFNFFATHVDHADIIQSIQNRLKLMNQKELQSLETMLVNRAEALSRKTSRSSISKFTESIVEDYLNWEGEHRSHFIINDLDKSQV